MAGRLCRNAYACGIRPGAIDQRLHLVYGDLNDASSLNKILKIVRPDEIYNLGAQSHVKVSFDIPEYTAEITGVGTVRLLEAMRELTGFRLVPVAPVRASDGRVT